MFIKGESRNAGESNPAARLTAEQARQIVEIRRPFNGKRLDPGEPGSIDWVAERFGISRGQVSKIARNQLWRTK